MDILKCFAIILVLWGHSIQHLTARYAASTPYENNLYAFIYSFHMPLFMIVSGFFARGAGEGTTFKEMLLKRVIQLIVPSLFAAAMMWVWMFGTGEWFPREYYLTGGLWFLKSLFLCAVVYYICTMFRYRNAVLLISLVLSQFINIFHFSWMYPCFLFGSMLRGWMPWFRAHSRVLMAFSGAMFLILFLLFEKEFVQVPKISEILRDIARGEWSTASVYGFNRLYRMAIGLSGSTFFILLFDSFVALFVEKCKGLARHTLRVGTLTLGIYVLQTFILEWFLRSIISYEGSLWFYNWILTPAISLAVLAICVFIINLIGNTRLGGLLILGKSPRPSDKSSHCS